MLMNFLLVPALTINEAQSEALTFMTLAINCYEKDPMEISVFARDKRYDVQLLPFQYTDVHNTEELRSLLP